MICPQCSNGFLLEDSFSPIKPLVFIYRGYSRQVATQVLVCCSNCSYESTGSQKAIDLDYEWAEFKRYVNKAIIEEEI